jgi:calcium/calmodulin-dependent 3',5'-cyclic nucleotide phosphodiesterase
MQFTNYLLMIMDPGLIEDNFIKFTLLISALCHDVAHTGRTNLFEMNSLSPLAIRYHDRSVYF